MPVCVRCRAQSLVHVSYGVQSYDETSIRFCQRGGVSRLVKTTCLSMLIRCAMGLTLDCQLWILPIYTLRELLRLQRAWVINQLKTTSKHEPSAIWTVLEIRANRIWFRSLHRCSMRSSTIAKYDATCSLQQITLFSTRIEVKSKERLFVTRTRIGSCQCFTR